MAQDRQVGERRRGCRGVASKLVELERSQEVLLQAQSRFESGRRSLDAALKGLAGGQPARRLPGPHGAAWAAIA